MPMEVFVTSHLLQHTSTKVKRRADECPVLVKQYFATESLEMEYILKAIALKCSCSFR